LKTNGLADPILIAVGGFSSQLIFGEDTVTAGSLLLAGWKIADVAGAQVYHSHACTLRQEFKRYFDIGVLHAKQPWVLREFGQTGAAGRRFVRSELS
jgi:rhamnosyltransferase